MVSRDGPFPPKSRQSESGDCATLDAEASAGCMVEEMERHLGVQRRQGVRFVSS